MKKILAILLSICLLSSLAFLLLLNQKATWEEQYQIVHMTNPYSDSMEPTINRGDILVVDKTVNPAELIAGPKDAPIAGDILAFYHPAHVGDPEHIMAHRAVGKELNNEKWYFRTRGDANFANDPWQLPQDYIIGKVVDINPPLTLVYWNLWLWLAAAISIGTGVSSLLIVLLMPRKKMAGRVKCQCGYEYEGKTLPQRCPQCGKPLRESES